MMDQQNLGTMRPASADPAAIALAKALGIPHDPKAGGLAHGIVYVVFPGAAVGFPTSQDVIRERGAAALRKWGGPDKVKACFPQVTWAPEARSRPRP